MCGRYYIDDGIDADELQEIIDTVNRRSNADQVKTSGEVFPTDTVPIIANSRAMAPSAFAMSWGYSLPGGKRIINARSESAEEKPMFRDGMAQRRCAVPATNYFEWERVGKQKTKYAIRPAGSRLMYMVGIYRVEMNCSPKVRQYGILNNERGANYAERKTQQEIHCGVQGTSDQDNARRGSKLFRNKQTV